jgi:hypothetical protein
MTRFAGRGLARTAAFAMALAAAGAGACTGTKVTELVPGVSTQIQVPRDLAAVRLDLFANGALVFCRPYAAYDGSVTLPSTLGVLPAGSPDTTVTVTIGGYDQAGAAASGGALNDCGQTQKIDPSSPGNPRLVRRSIQTYVGGHTLFLPMPLSFSCFDQDCSAMGANYSCRGAQCVADPDPATVAKKLVDFTPALIDGTDVCFSPSRCFPADLHWDAVPVASEDCTFTLPPEAEPGLGINVRVFYEQRQWAPNATTRDYETALVNGGEAEILDEDETEGFTVIDSKTFKLAPGLCALVGAATSPPPAPTTGTLNYSTITDVEVSTLCTPKTQLLPFCAGERTTYVDGGPLPSLPDGAESVDGLCNVAQRLLPTPSAAYLVMDDSEVMHKAFGTDGAATVLSLSLADPVFQRTSAAFKFLTHNGDECTSATTTLTSPTIPFDKAATVQPLIARALMGWMPPDPAAPPYVPLDLLAALRPVGAYGALSSFLANREAPDVAAVMFFVNRVPGGTATNPDPTDDCPTASVTDARAQVEAAVTAAFNETPSLQTYFVVLASDVIDEGVYDFYLSIQNDLPQAVTTIDARDSSTTLANFSSVVTRLGTCLYEAPTGVNLANGVVQYDPLVPGIPPITVPRDPQCVAETQTSTGVNGWNIDAEGRLRICGAACTSLRGAILQASAVALANNESAPDVPVTATLTCQAAGTDSGAGIDGTTSGGDATSQANMDSSVEGASSPGAGDAASATADGGQDRAPSAAMDAASDAGSVDASPIADSPAGDDGGGDGADGDDSSAELTDAGDLDAVEAPDSLTATDGATLVEAGATMQ